MFFLIFFDFGLILAEFMPKIMFFIFDEE